MKRQRGRNRNNNNNNRHNNNPNRSLDSNGPDVKVRGSASTIYEKYTQLARDAQSNGSRVKAENYLQHAEHYLRLVNKLEAEKKAREEEREAQQAARRERGEDDEDNNSRRTRGKSRRETSGDENKPAEMEEGKPRRTRRKPKDTEADSAPEASPQAESADTDLPDGASVPGLEVVETADDGAKPARRRAAPRRKKSGESIDAAE
jgi:hypothetical protein